MKRTLMIATLLLLPSIACAAGFAKQSIFLSKSSVTEGEAVLVHAVLQNDATTKFSGDVVIEDGNLKIGTIPLSLAAGEASAVSISWKPLAGSHTVTAQLRTSDGAVVEQESAVFVIKEKPAPPPPAATHTTLASSSSAAAAVESSQNIQHAIGGVAPPVEQAAQPVFSFIDGTRQQAADALDKGIAWSKDNLAKSQTKPGEVSGAETQKPSGFDPLGSLWYVLYTLCLYLFTILRWLVGNAGVFYPILALLFFYALWWSYKRVRRPHY